MLKIIAIIDQKNKDVALIRQQMLATNEGTLKEISILKDQVGDLQIKLGDALRGSALTQHKETSARRDSENEKVRAEVAHSEPKLTWAWLSLLQEYTRLNINDNNKVIQQ